MARPEKVNRLGVAAYTVGWIAALSLELAPAAEMLDEEHDQPSDFDPSKNPYLYTWGRMGDHTIVMCCIEAGRYGTTSAAQAGERMASTFPNLKFGLMVGIGAGFPRVDEDGNVKPDIRLGDVVVSQPSGASGGVFQYDLVKLQAGGKSEIVSFLNSPPQVLLSALSTIQMQHRRRASNVPEILRSLPEFMQQPQDDEPGYVYQGPDHDSLYDAAYTHAKGDDCRHCDPARRIHRRDRGHTPAPRFHYGIIASGNSLVKDPQERDRIARLVSGKCICFEMEAAGLMNGFPCLVIRGISDYADSHKNDQWQPYAAATAAAYTKELLGYIPGERVEKAESAKAILAQLNEKLTESDMRSWLRPPNASTDLNRVKSLPHKTPCSWILDTETFLKWRSESPSFLWIHGIPGCGKTTLTSSLIDFLSNDTRQSMDHEPAKNSSALVYFFLDFQDEKKQSLNQMLRWFISQIFCSHEETRQDVEDIYKKCNKGLEDPNDNQLRKLFGDMTAKLPCTYLVIDAVDEAPGASFGGSKRMEILDWICSLPKSSNGNIRVLATSRTQHDIEQWLSSIGHSLCIDQLVDEDIQTYVKDRLFPKKADTEEVDISDDYTRRPGFSRWNSRPEVLLAIEKSMVEKAKGMFKLVAGQLDILEGCLDPSEIEDTLRDLPQTLNEMYGRILNDICSSHQCQQRQLQAIRLLQFLVFSERPLTVGEAVDALAVNLNETPSFKVNNRMPRIEEVTQYCPSLVTVDLSENGTLEVHSTIRLSHSTVWEYLTSEKINQDWGENFEEPQARLPILQVCLAYANVLWIEDPFDSKASFHLSEYVGKFLFSHARVVDSDPDGTELLVKFLQHPHALKAWVCRFSADTRNYLRKGIDAQRPWPGRPEGEFQESFVPSALLLAAHFNLKNTMSSLIENGVKHRHRIIPAFELPFGFFTTASSVKCSKTPLYVSVEAGHKEIAEMLVKASENVEATLRERGGSKGRALDVALFNSNYDMFEFLLEEERFKAYPHGYLMEMFRDAAKLGHMEVVKIFQKHRIGPNKGEVYYEIALYEASRAGMACVVRAILDGSASTQNPTAVEIPSDLSLTADQRIGKPLHVASFYGHEQTVRELLDGGADINQVDQDFGTPLQAAAIGKHKEIIETLLNEGACVNATGGVFGTALRASLEPDRAGRYGKECEEKMKTFNKFKMINDGDLPLVLLRRGAMPLRHQGYLNLALELSVEAIPLHMIAVAKRNRDSSEYDTLESLFHPGDDANMQAFFKAISHNFERVVVEMLLHDPCAIQLRTEQYETGLHVGARAASDSVFEKLVYAALDSKSEDLFMAKDHKGMTPLHTAVRCGDAVKVKILQGAGELLGRFDQILQAVDNDYMTCLHFSVEGNNADITEALIKAASPTTMAGILLMKSNQCMSLLHLGALQPCSSDPTSVCSILIEAARQSDTLLKVLDIRDKYGRTPLHCAASAQQSKLACTLLTLGYDPLAKDTAGLTYLDHAKISYGYDPTPTWYKEFWAMSFNESEAPSGPEKEEVFLANASKLLYHAKSGNCAAVEEVLSHGLDELSFVNVRTEQDDTALHLAVRNQSFRMTESLLIHDADVNVHDLHGMTPLHYAAKTGDLEILRLLGGQEGAVLNACDKQVRTPLDCAIHAGNEAAIQWLRSQTRSHSIVSTDFYGEEVTESDNEESMAGDNEGISDHDGEKCAEEQHERKRRKIC